MTPMAEKTEDNFDATTSGGANETIDAAGNPDIDSKYRLILIAAQRSKQLQRGAQPRINVDPRKIKPTRIALEEVKKGKVGFRLTKEK